MSQQPQMPNQQQFSAFASKLKDFRETLPTDEQHMLDAMVAAAFQHEEKQDVQGYWWAPYPAYPVWYTAPVYYGTPWATYYGYGYRVWYP